MALKNQLSFASGEIDPVLHDRVTLQRFQNGLETARNVMISKSGSIMSRFSRLHVREVHHDGPIVLFCPPEREDFIEFGVRSTDDKFYVRYYNYDLDNQQISLSYEFIEANAGDSEITEDNLEKLQFVVDKNLLYIFFGSNDVTTPIHRLRIGVSPSFTADVTIDIPSAPTGGVTFTESGAPSGYEVDYAFTYIKDGEESKALPVATTAINRPAGTGQQVEIIITLNTETTLINDYKEVRVYRRPKEGAAFGFLGATSNIYVDGPNLKARFVDVGADADFTNGIPSLVSKEGISSADPVSDLSFGTGVIYQGRLILGNIKSLNAQAVLASRPSHSFNFYRDFPYDADSALLFKAGSEGNATILRMIDADGLIVFTTRGVFVSVGLLSPTNNFLDRRGNWVIDEDVPPLLIPGALLFVEKSTGRIKELIYSQEKGTYITNDKSIFSNHLFRGKKIKSWSYQDGFAPLLLVTFDDGTFASFTYDYEHQMNAWTRHDSKFPIEQVVSTTFADTSFFVSNKNGTRVIERTVPRVIAGSKVSENPEVDKTEYGAFMDSISITSDLMNTYLAGNTISVAPVTPDVWDGELTLTSSQNLFDVVGPPNFGAGFGNAGEKYRFFNPVTRAEVTLTYISTVDGNNVIVQPDDEFPSEYASDFRLYNLQTTITGLSHLEGEKVAVLGDGKVLASPNNDDENVTFLDLTVTGGEITLPDEFASAIVVVGRPITADIKTLNVSTIEQSPTIIESLTCNKLYVRTYESRGLYVDNNFPEERLGEKDGDTVEDMQSFDDYVIDNEAPLIMNRYKQPESRRYEVSLSGDWESQGKVSLRQVDPIHCEILSIIGDFEVERRRN